MVRDKHRPPHVLTGVELGDVRGGLPPASGKLHIAFRAFRA